MGKKWGYGEDEQNISWKINQTIFAPTERDRKLKRFPNTIEVSKAIVI